MNTEKPENSIEDISTRDYKGFMPGYIWQGIPPYLQILFSSWPKLCFIEK